MSNPAAVFNSTACSGMLRLNQSQFSAAADAFTHATEIDADYAIGWCNLGFAQLRLNDVDAPLASFQKATESDPKLGQGWNGLAEGYEKKGQLSKCDDAARHSVALSYDQPRLWAPIANHSFMRGLWEDYLLPE